MGGAPQPGGAGGAAGRSRRLRPTPGVRHRQALLPQPRGARADACWPAAPHHRRQSGPRAARRGRPDPWRWRPVINLAQIPRDIIAIGASAGGVEALIALFAKLPQGLPAAIAAVIHRSPVFETQLPAVLGRRSLLPVLEPEDNVPFMPGRIYIAPRDRHLILQDGVVRLSGGAKEHRTRPAIDPLFTSAAHRYGPRVVGVL